MDFMVCLLFIAQQLAYSENSAMIVPTVLFAGFFLIQHTMQPIM